jgi:hypothetical protein
MKLTKGQFQVGRANPATKGQFHVRRSNAATIPIHVPVLDQPLKAERD